MIYFLRCNCTNGFIKIGVARDLWQRIDTLKAASPYELRLVRVLAGGRSEERTIHEQFADARHRGEWFRPTENLLRFIIRSRDRCLGLSPATEPVAEWTIGKAKVAALKARERVIRMVGATGIEPVTPSMSRRCSSAELRARRFDEPEPVQKTIDQGS